MFVSIAVDPGSRERAGELADLLAQYGFKMVQRGIWECHSLSHDTLNRVKKDLDKATDASDRLRLFQFPLDGTLVISSLAEKKWRRMVAKIQAEQDNGDLARKRAARHGAGQNPAKRK